MQNGPEHNKIFDGGCILAQNAVKYSLTYTKKLSVKPAAHGQARLHTTSQALRASSPGRGASGEEMGLYDMPRPPLGRRGGIAQR